MAGSTERELGSQLRAVAVVSRLSATVGYNVASVLLAVGLGVRVGGRPGATALWIAVGYAAATVIAKFAASVADAIHDRAVDAANPEKDVIASAVETLGVRRAWWLLGGYLLAATGLYAAVAAAAGGWVLPASAAVIGFGFTYSYPPRFKERGVWNHVVTTGVDAGLLVLPVAVLVAGRVAPAILVAAGVVACYSFGYHVLHQAADVHFDRQSGVETFATELGVADTIRVGAIATAAATGFALALGYSIAAVVLGGVTAFYLDVYDAVSGADPDEASLALAERFNIAWVATLANAALAVSVWRHALDVGTALL